MRNRSLWFITLWPLRSAKYSWWVSCAEYVGGLWIYKATIVQRSCVYLVPCCFVPLLFCIAYPVCLLSLLNMGCAPPIIHFMFFLSFRCFLLVFYVSCLMRAMACFAHIAAMCWILYAPAIVFALFLFILHFLMFSYVSAFLCVFYVSCLMLAIACFARIAVMRWILYAFAMTFAICLFILCCS